MGQKTHPIGFRLGITKDWDSKWFTKHEFAKFIQIDNMLRKYIKQRLRGGAISKIQIERTAKRLLLSIHTARPGIVIGRKGVLIDRLREEIKLIVDRDVTINVQEIRNPEIDAALVSEAVARQIEQRVSYRRAMKRAIGTAMRLGAQGIRVACKGRLGGAEIARQEWHREGKMPLHTIKAPIDYASATARTMSGTIGIKVWIYKKEEE